MKTKKRVVKETGWLVVNTRFPFTTFPLYYGDYYRTEEQADERIEEGLDLSGESRLMKLYVTLSYSLPIPKTKKR